MPEGDQACVVVSDQHHFDAGDIHRAKVFFHIPVHTLLQLSLVFPQSFCDNFSPEKAISNLGCYKHCLEKRESDLQDLKINRKSENVTSCYFITGTSPL